MTKTFNLIFSIVLFFSLSLFQQANCAKKGKELVNFPGGRIALSNDGNQHDPDDIIALPLALALIDAAGLKDKVVHVEHSNHVCSNNPNLHRRMIESAYGTIVHFGYNQSVIFDYISQGTRATENFINEINKSTADDKLWVLAAGPMETVYRAIKGANPEKLKYVVLISHSTWNERHGDCGPDASRKWIDIQNEFSQYGLFFVSSCGGGKERCTDEQLNNPLFLADQNNSKEDLDFNTPIDKWHWLRDSKEPKLRWLFSRNPFNNKFDPSDAGMAYFLITGGPWNGGNKTAGWPEAKILLENPVKVKKGKK
jgi:hypothetical protein